MTRNHQLPKTSSKGRNVFSRVQKSFTMFVATVLAGSTLSVSAIAQQVGLTAGEFRVDESGAATYSMPINLPAGRAGVAPQVGIAYSSNNVQEGPVGVGWSITGLSSISRCPQTPVHDDGEIRGVQYDSDDKFCLDGQRLLLKSGTYGAAGSTYFTEVDNFALITAHGQASDGGPMYFTVENKAGETHYYGDATNALTNQAYAGADAFVEPSGGAVPVNIARSWAIKIIEDVKGNFIKFNYAEDNAAGTFYIDNIEYAGWTDGSTLEAPFAKVHFEYVPYEKGFIGFMAGGQVYHNQLLSRIDTITDNEVFRSYHLDYERNEAIEDRTLLTSVQECTDIARTSCLPATSFTWQRPNPSTETTVRQCETEPGFEHICFDTPTTTNYQTLPTVTSNVATNTKSDDTAQVLDINGDGYSDIVYVDDSVDRWKVKLGPTFITTHTFPRAYLLGLNVPIGVSKPEFALNIDYNGDGVRDLLVANSDTTNWYAMTFVKDAPTGALCDQTDGCSDFTSSAGTYLVEDTGLLATGFEGEVQVLDVDGDGLEDIVYRDAGQIKAGINQLGGGFIVKSIYSEPSILNSTFFQTSHTSQTASIKSSSGIDINGDGRSDMISKIRETTHECLVGGRIEPAMGAADCADQGGTYNSNTVTEYRTYMSVGTASTPQLVEGERLGDAMFMNTLRVADFNGDGLSDIAYVNQNDMWFYRLSNGKYLLPAQSMGLSTSETRKHQTYFLDLNADGRADVLRATSSTNWSVYFSRPSSDSIYVSFELRGTKTFTQDAGVRFGDTDGDGKLDLLLVKNGSWAKHSSRIGIKEYAISDITNGFGVNTHIDYEPMTDTSVYVMRASDNDATTDTFSPVSGMQVVSQVTSDINTGKTVSVSYQYGGMLVHKKGRGGLGFQMLRTTDNQTGVVSETQYNQDHTGDNFAKARMPIYTQQSYGTFTISRASNTLAVQDTAQFSTVTLKKGVMPYISEATEEQYVVNTGLTSSTHVANTVTTTGYDSWGNVTSSNIVVSDLINTGSLTTNTVNDFGINATQKRLGRLQSTTVTKTRTGQPAIARKTSFQYNGDNMLWKSIVSPDESVIRDSFNKAIAAAKLTTTYSYDKYGNKTQVDVTGFSTVDGAEQTRSSYTTFSTNGRFVDYVQDDLGQKVTYQYNELDANTFTGGILRSTTKTSPNSLSTLTNVDKFGNVTSVKDATNNTVTTERFYTYGTEVTGSHYKITQINPGAADSEVFYDKWGREIGKHVQGFDGQWILTKATYDDRGRLSHSYEPGSSTLSTRYTYDNLDRVEEITSPNNGKVLQSTIGLTTTTTNELLQVSEVTSNAFGETIQTRDNIGNTVDFVYDSYGNLLTSTTTADGKTSEVHAYYDKWGRKYRTDDPVKGTWLYTYNAFGELYTQQTANQVGSNDQFTFTYDELGRKIRSYEPSEGTLCWVYGTGSTTKDKGKLINSYKYEGANAACGSAGADIAKTFSYDNFGRPDQIDTAIKTGTGTVTYTQKQTYDGNSRPLTTTYPLGSGPEVAITNTYNNTGYLHQVKQGTTVLKTINAMNERLQVTSISYNNNVDVTNVFDDVTGWVSEKTVSKNSTAINALTMTYDQLGNLRTRESNYSAGVGSNSNYTETYNYDALNRLDDREIAYTDVGALPDGFTTNQNYDYDGWGNFTFKHGAGHYVYHATEVHRLMGVYENEDQTGQLYSFAYDNNGNVVSDGTREFTYGSFDKPVFMRTTDGKASSRMEYGVDRELYRKEDCFYDLNKVKNIVTTTYVGAYEKVERIGGESDLTEHKYNIGEMIITQRSDATSDIFYVHKDHQGSSILITDNSGDIVSEAIYDPWGKRSEIYQKSVLAGFQILPPTDRGYTGHKHIAGMNIIHMGGRIYDPTLGRFLQADPHIQAPLNSQNYNRYSYVLNNPMSYTDPSGYFFKKIGKLFGNVWQATVGNVLRAIAKVPVLNSLVQIAFCTYGGPVGCAAFSAASTYAVTGSLGASLKAGAITFATATALQHVGNSDYWGQAGSPQNILANATVGGVSSSLQGGKFGHGFFSAGITSAFKPQINKIGGGEVEFKTERVMAAAVIGGTASAVSGGKFANGAITGAFIQLYNAETRLAKDKFNEELSALQKEIFEESIEHIQRIEKFINDRDWEGARAAYPHLKGITDSLSMYANLHQMRRDFQYFAGTRLQGKLVAEGEVVIKFAHVAKHFYIDKNPISILQSVVDLFWSPPPPIQHQFLYSTSSGVDINFVKRK